MNCELAYVIVSAREISKGRPVCINRGSAHWRKANGRGSQYPMPESAPEPVMTFGTRARAQPVPVLAPGPGSWLMYIIIIRSQALNTKSIKYMPLTKLKNYKNCWRTWYMFKEWLKIFTKCIKIKPLPSLKIGIKYEEMEKCFINVINCLDSLEDSFTIVKLSFQKLLYLMYSLDVSHKKIWK